jgi:protein-S-isoprenylcysteine O-methyltransferase Ste14
MDTLRYVVALVVLMSLVPGIFLWFLIHPFGAFWRGMRPWISYLILTGVTVLLMAGVFFVRRPFLTADWGTNYVNMALGAVAMVIGTLIALKRKRHLTFSILSGLPQLSAERYPGKLLTEGIYGRIRHPRYVEVALWVIGYALATNFPSLYVAALLTIPALLLIVVLEERELEVRFGEEWRAYKARVPRFFPAVRP